MVSIERPPSAMPTNNQITDAGAHQKPEYNVASRIIVCVKNPPRGASDALIIGKYADAGPRLPHNGPAGGIACLTNAVVPAMPNPSEQPSSRPLRAGRL